MRKLSKYYKNELIRLIVGIACFALALIFEFAKCFVTSVILYLIALVVSGAPVFISAARGILRRDLFDEKFLMSIAAIGAMIIGDMSEGVAVMLFFLVGEIFEHKAVRKSRSSIKALMSIRPDGATVVIDGREKNVDADDVAVGTEIIIRGGQRVPIDSIVISGNADVDTSMLTGESLPRAVGTGSPIQSGTIVLSGVLTARTEKPADESSAQRILELVECATENKSKEENFITVFSRVYAPIVVGLAFLMALLPPLVFEDFGWSESVYRALTFLVISCPCALVISVPMAFFGGIGGAAANGILFKGGNVFSPLSKADTFVFDKTGTLTTGKIKVEKILAHNIDEDALRYYAASAEYSSIHPISAAVRAICSNPNIPEKSQEIAGKGVIATVDGKDILVGNESLFLERGVDIPSGLEGGVLVSVDGVFSGELILGDSIKSEAYASIQNIKQSGVKKLYMLSGDKSQNAHRVACDIGIDNAVGELLPENKYEKIKEIIGCSGKAVFVGDGINDAPALAVADVGIAMGGIGSDSAIEAADVVIMNDDLTKLPMARRIARRTIFIAKENIIFAIGVKALVLILGALGYADMWLAVFADVGVALIAILNSMRALKVKK